MKRKLLGVLSGVASLGALASASLFGLLVVFYEGMFSDIDLSAAVTTWDYVWISALFVLGIGLGVLSGYLFLKKAPAS